MTLPKISVIVPVYNVEEYLAECLDSILHQTLKDLEIICVNDGTKDNSVKILEDYQKQDPRIKILHKENGGLSSARNAGMKVATGEYIGFVDSDDWIDAEFFEKLYTIAKENTADMAMGNTEYYYSDGKKNSEPSYITTLIKAISPNIVEAVEDRKKVIETSVVWNKIFLREFIGRNGFVFYEGLYWEDNPFTIMATLKANKIGLVRDASYHYRIHGKSIMETAGADRKSFDIFEIMAKLKVFFDKEQIERMEGYRHYYAELVFFYYNYHLFNRIHDKYKKEFYYRVQSEFRKLDGDSIKHLSHQHRVFQYVLRLNYTLFSAVYIAFLIYSKVFQRSGKR